jgi:hypothetical protein
MPSKAGGVGCSPASGLAVDPLWTFLDLAIASTRAPSAVIAVFAVLMALMSINSLFESIATLFCLLAHAFFS